MLVPEQTAELCRTRLNSFKSGEELTFFFLSAPAPSFPPPPPPPGIRKSEASDGRLVLVVVVLLYAHAEFPNIFSPSFFPARGRGGKRMRGGDGSNFFFFE